MNTLENKKRLNCSKPQIQFKKLKEEQYKYMRKALLKKKIEMNEIGRKLNLTKTKV